jgi:hypothetical protein
MTLDKSDYLKLLPESALEWKASDDGIIYDTNTLYDYIDGGAELYISYGFRNVFSREYANKDQPLIHVEIFDMGSSANAYGVFTNTTETDNTEIGQGAQYIEGSLLFWKDNFFVSLFADTENPQIKEALFTLARFIDSKITSTGKKPEIIHYLPGENINSQSFVYMIHHAWQNYYHYISDENIFGISADNDALLAQYHLNNDKGLILLVEYNDENEAEENFNSLNTAFADQISSSGLIDLRGDMKGELRKVNDKIVLVGGTQQETVQSIMQQILNHINEIHHGK